MAKSPTTPRPKGEPAKRGEGKRVAAVRDKFKTAMDDPDFRERMERYLRELLNQGRGS
jgi:hypothetical protein